MANKIGDLEDRIVHFIQESLHELDSIRSEESERLEQARKRFRELTQDLRDLATQIDRTLREYEQLREELLRWSQQGVIEQEKEAYERASQSMKLHASLEERYRILSAQKDDLLREERSLERLVTRSESMGNRLRMVMNLVSLPEEFSPEQGAMHNEKALSVAFQIAEREARSFVRADSRQFVDADKIIAAGLELETLLEDPKETEDNGKAICHANLKIRIPDTILKTAIDNSPLIYGNTPLSDMLEQKLMGSNLTFENNTFSTTLLYTPDKDGKPVLEDNTLSTTAQTLSATLLPYGVKSIVMIDGKPVSKEQAIKLLQNQNTEEPPTVDPQDILENNAASQAVGLTDDDDNSDYEVLRPDRETPRNEPPGLSQSELDNARAQNRQADGEINDLWGGMDSDVKQQILGEQRAWIQSKKLNCQQAAASADNTAQAEYLRLQCETRMTRERTQYLRGYSIN